MTVLALWAASACAQPTAQPWTVLSPAVREKLARRGDLTLAETPLRQALFGIGEQWQVNIVVAADVEGTVNGLFKQAPLHEILDAILLANGYGYRPVGESFVVMKLEALGDFNPMFVSETISLRAVKPDDILATAQSLSSPGGKVQAVASARCLLVFDFPDRVEMIREFATRLDEATTAASQGGQGGGFDVFHYVPQFVKALSLKESLTTLLSPEGKLTVVEPENQIVVIDHPNVLAMVRKATLELDMPRGQVRISAIIYDVSLDDLEKCGINWNHAAKARHDATGTAQMAYSIDSLTQVPAVAGDPSGVMTLMSLSRYFDITAAIDFLSESDNSQLLADPMVIVSDMEDAEIAIVTEIPYQQLTQTQQGGNIGTTSFREAGVKLMVRPQIAADGTVLMNVTPEFSRLTGFTDGQQPQPIIDRRTAKTVVRVLNQQTFVIGGLRQRSDIDNVRGLPYLMDIKFLGIGKLFRSRKTETKETELVVFLTPEILGPCNPNTPREHAAAAHSQSSLEQVPVAGQTPFPTPCVAPNLPPAAGLPEEVPAVESMPAPDTGVPTPALPPQARHAKPQVTDTTRSATAGHPSGGSGYQPAPRPARPPVSSPDGVIDLRPRDMRDAEAQPRPEPPLVGPRLGAQPPAFAPPRAPAIQGPASPPHLAARRPLPSPHAAQPSGRPATRPMMAQPPAAVIRR